MRGREKEKYTSGRGEYSAQTTGVGSGRGGAKVIDSVAAAATAVIVIINGISSPFLSFLYDVFNKI